MIRVGLVGCGAWGRNYLGAVRRSGQGTVTHVVRPSSSSPVDLSGVTVSDDVESLVRSVDAVIVASPPDTHVAVCEAALSAGRPTMVEKPVSLSVQQVVRLSRRVWDSGVPFLVNHVHLFSSAYERLRDEWVSRRGRTFSVSSNGRANGPFRDYDPLWDYGPHDVSMLHGLDILGLRLSSAFRIGDGAARAYEARFDSWSSGWSRGSATLLFGNSATIKTRRFSVETDGFRAVYDDRAEAKLVINDRPVWDTDPTPPLDRAVSAFLRSCATSITDWRFGVGIAVGVTSILDSIQKDSGP